MLLMLHHRGHSHTYLQYLINELVFGRITPSKTTLKIITLSGICQCHTLTVVPQAQGREEKKKKKGGQYPIFKISTH